MQRWRLCSRLTRARSDHRLGITDLQPIANATVCGTESTAAAATNVNATSRRHFHGQRDTPIVPQAKVAPPSQGDHRPRDGSMHVGYLLSRNPVVKPDAHPLEQEMAFLLDREHQRYSRHPEEHANAFFAQKAVTLDSWNRHEPSKVLTDFYSLPSYNDAVQVVLKRYQPAPRLQQADFWDPFDAGRVNSPPPRHTLARGLSEFLYLIVKYQDSQRWGVPYSYCAAANGGAVAVPTGVLPNDGGRRVDESLRLALDHTIVDHHGDSLDTYCNTNCPQGVISMRGTDTAAVDSGAPQASMMYIFVPTYLSGRPKFSAGPANAAGESRGVQPAIVDHAWVTRRELLQYEYALGPRMASLLQDIATDAHIEGP